MHLALEWTFLLVFNVVVFNMMPLTPFDGDKFLYYIAEKVTKGRGREVRIFFNAMSVGLMALNMILSFVRYGLLSF